MLCLYVDGIFAFSNIYYLPSKTRLGFLDFPRYPSTARCLNDNLACPSTKNEVKKIGRIRLFLKTFCFTLSLEQNKNHFCLTRPQFVCSPSLLWNVTDTLTNLNKCAPELTHLKCTAELKWPRGQSPGEPPLQEIQNAKGPKGGVGDREGLG